MTASKTIIEFVRLKSKMYSIKTESYESKRAKLINQGVVENNVRHQNFKEYTSLQDAISSKYDYN